MSPDARVAPQVTMSLPFKALGHVLQHGVHPGTLEERSVRGARGVWAAPSRSPKPGEHVQLFRMEWDRNKGFYSEKR